MRSVPCCPYFCCRHGYIICLSCSFSRPGWSLCAFIASSQQGIFEPVVADWSTAGQTFVQNRLVIHPKAAPATPEVLDTSAALSNEQALVLRALTSGSRIQPGVAFSCTTPWMYSPPDKGTCARVSQVMDSLLGRNSCVCLQIHFPLMFVALQGRILQEFSCYYCGFVTCEVVPWLQCLREISPSSRANQENTKSGNVFGTFRFKFRFNAFVPRSLDPCDS